MKNGFRFHKATRARHREDILRFLENKPSTFTELLGATELSRPALSSHMKELVADNMVEHDDKKRTYGLTQRGKVFELLGTNIVSAGLKAAGKIVRDPKSAELLENMAKMAKQNPEMFNVIMDWALDLALFMGRNPLYESHWLKVLGGDKEAWEPFREEIERRTATAQPKTIEEFRLALDDIQAGIKKVFERGSKGK